MGSGQKSYKASMVVPPAPVRVLSKRPCAPSVTSVTSVANDKGDNEMILGAVHSSPGFALRLRKPRKTSARRPSDEGAVRPVIASNGVPFLQMRPVGSHSTSGRKKEGKKESMGFGLMDSQRFSININIISIHM